MPELDRLSLTGERARVAPAEPSLERVLGSLDATLRTLAGALDRFSVAVGRLADQGGSHRALADAVGRLNESIESTPRVITRSLQQTVRRNEELLTAIRREKAGVDPHR